MLVFFTLLEMLLCCLLGSNIFFCIVILIYIFCPIFGFFFISLDVNSLFDWFYFLWIELCCFFLACIKLGVNTVIIGGESLNSGYSLLGGVRALVQTALYEVWLVFILVYFVVLICGYRLFLFLPILLMVNYSFSFLVTNLIYFLFGWDYPYSFWFCWRRFWACFWFVILNMVVGGLL